MLNKLCLAFVGALTVLPQLAVAGDNLASRCVDVSVPKHAITARNGKWIELTPEQWQFLRGIYAMNPGDARRPALWRQGRAGAGRGQQRRAGVLHRRRQGLHADAGPARTAGDDARRRDGDDQSRRERAVTGSGRFARGVPVSRDPAGAVGAPCSPVPPARAGSSIARARLGKASILLGSAIAATKWSWKRGSIAVSIFSTRRTTSSISLRAARLSKQIRAPVPAALPAAATLAEIAIGDEAERHRIGHIDMAAERAGQRHPIGRRGAIALEQQFGAGVERGLGELDGAHVGLVDLQARRAVMQHIGESAADRLDARRFLRRARRR